MSDAERTAQDDAVRRLLAEARHDEPIPADVATRLDDVLAELGTERSSHGHLVTPLATRRRRVGSLLVAAAAVVAVGLGLDQVVDAGGQDAMESQGESAVAGGAGEAEDEEGAGADTDAGAGALSTLPPAAPVLSRLPVVRVDPDGFARDVRRAKHLLDVRDAAERTASTADREQRKRRRSRLAWAGCTRDVVGPGRLVPVRYAGQAAVLAFRPPLGETEVVDLVECPGGGVLRSTTLPR